MTETKPLIILDLDGTCITEADRRHDSVFRIGSDQLTFRPHLFLFLTRLKSDYAFAVWSASEAKYVQGVAAELTKEIQSRSNDPSFAFVFVWSGKKCVPVRHMDGLYSFQKGVYKPLTKVWKAYKGIYTRSNTWIIDDTPRTYQRNYGNAKAVSTWTGNSDDREWRRLFSFFQKQNDDDHGRKSSVGESRQEHD